MLSNHLILWHPLLLLTSIFVSIRDFTNELALQISWPKYWSFSTSLPNEYSRLIYFRIDWFDFFAIQGTLIYINLKVFSGGVLVKNPLANVGDARDTGSIPGLRKSPGIGNSKPLQYSCLENSIDRGTWPQSMGLQSQTPLSVHAHTHTHTHTILSFTSHMILNISLKCSDPQFPLLCKGSPTPSAPKNC